MRTSVRTTQPPPAVAFSSQEIGACLNRAVTDLPGLRQAVDDQTVTVQKAMYMRRNGSVVLHVYDDPHLARKEAKSTRPGQVSNLLSHRPAEDLMRELFADPNSEAATRLTDREVYEAGKQVAISSNISGNDLRVWSRAVFQFLCCRAGCPVVPMESQV